MAKLDLLAVALGLAALAGINLYLTVFVTGLAIHFHWITLAPQYQSLEVVGNPWIITVAGVLYFLEFFADKIPWVDSIWDAVHTVIRPIGGALLAIQSYCSHRKGSDAPCQQHIAGTIFEHWAKPWRRRCGPGRAGSRSPQSRACPDRFSDRHRCLFLFCAKNFTRHESENLAGLEKTQ